MHSSPGDNAPTTNPSRNPEVILFKNIARITMAAAFFFAAHALRATDGYFVTGYGAIQQGKGGAGIAAPGDSLAPAYNPAGLFAAGNLHAAEQK